MIKRQFYKVEHGDQDDPSGSSSSSSDSEVEAAAAASGEESGDGAATEEVREGPGHSSTSSGYESEDSSGNEIAIGSTGSPVEEDDAETGKQALPESPLPGKPQRKLKEQDSETVEETIDIPAESLAYILICKSVFKCRICPRIVCLNEESLKAHLKSKRHIRSEKLLKDGRLKSMLNSDGEVEDQETAAEMNARIVSLAQDNPTKRKRVKQPKKRSKKKKLEAESGLEEDTEKTAEFSSKKATKTSSKKRHRK